MSEDSEVKDARILALERRINELGDLVDKRHNFSLHLFSCIINLWALALEIRDTSPNLRASETFMNELKELQTNINETQEASDDIIASFKNETV